MLGSLVSITLLGVGCSVLKPKPDLTQYYLLRAEAPVAATAPATSAHPTALVVGRGHVAEYLNPMPIIIAEGSNRLRRLEHHQWAEPLDAGVNRVLVENIERLLPGADLVAYPDTAPRSSALELRYHVFKLEGNLGRDVTLDVTWSIRQQPGTRMIAERTSTFTVPARQSSEEVGDYVTRLSQALTQWSVAVAESLAPGLRSLSDQ